MKKLAKYLRLLLILVGWTVFYLWIIGLIMNYFWHFNIFEKRYWLIISEFWSAGGVIDQPSEYMFLLMLVLIVPGWFWGFRKARQLSYVKIIFFPVFYQKFPQLSSSPADSGLHRPKVQLQTLCDLVIAELMKLPQH